MLSVVNDDGTTVNGSPLIDEIVREGARRMLATASRRSSRPACDSATVDGDRQIIDEVGAIADAHGVARAQVALAWLRRNPVVGAPSSAPAPSSRSTMPSPPSTSTSSTTRRSAWKSTPPRHDFQGISDARELERIKAGIPGYANV